jgi:hypothetical protein
MKLNYHFILAILFTLSFSAFSQFDSVLITKNIATNNFTTRNIIAMGDQNSDGYDDFIAYDCSTNVFYLYYGGNPPDTSNFLLFNYLVIGRGITSIDINHDDKLDIVLKNQDRKFLVFYGGANIDTIADLEFNSLAGSSGDFGYWIRNGGDFNGDGFDDLVMSDPYLPYSNEDIIVNYFFSTYPVFDTIPEMIFCGDTLNNVQKGINSFGDINGDGLQDFLYHGGGVPDSTKFMGIVLGNAQWDTTSVVIHYNSENIFNVIYTDFINDINRDGKDDILINSYGNFYPYYYTESILYGSIPFDVIPDVGLNTQNVGLSYGPISIGDVNGDGYNDFLALGQGFGYPYSRLWLGGSNINNHNLPVMGWGGSEDFFGGMINTVGDLDGDGVNDIVIGTAPMAVYCIDGYFKIFKGDTAVTTGIEEQLIFQPQSFELNEPYPNPFNPNVTIAFKLGNLSSITLTLYDILGKEIKQIISHQQMEAGKYEHMINTTELNLTSGVYVIQLQAISDNNIIFNSSKKVILLK